MRKPLSILCLMVIAFSMLCSCRYSDKIYYNHRGHAKRAFTKKYPPWYTFGWSRYNKDSKRTMRGWGRQNRY